MRYLALLLSLLFILMILATGCTNQPSYLGEPKDLPKSDAQNNYMQIKVFYPDRDAVVQEIHEIPKSTNKVEAALKVLFEGKPNNSNITPVMPEGVKIIGVKVDKDLTTINFNKNILFFEGDKTAQNVLLMAIASTAKQSKDIKQIKFLVEGKDKGQIDGRDIERFWGDVTLKDQPWKI